MLASFFCIGHRGAAGHEPENTLRSIQRALDLGAGGVEVDVRVSGDGKLMVFHDAKLRRTTGATGHLARKTLAELKQLDAGRGERIPTLREVLDLVAGRAWLNLELKARGTALPVSEEIIHAVEAKGSCWGFEQIVVSSFDRRELAAIADLRIRIGLLVARRPLNMRKLITRSRASSVHLPARLATPTMVERVHAAGVPAFVFTVNEPKKIARFRKMGVDGVFTDFPERAVGEGMQVNKVPPKI
jgi:glycerophosphoryl diester phosphodiesterase